jgi:5-methyltetrahydropteroyltriglutamate--homocysteine methyltransferase
MARTAVLGLPRMGPNRELKHALESYWAGRADEAALRESAWALRAASWSRARAAGIDAIPSGDVSLYDHVLDAAWAVGAIPERLGGPDADGLDAYFACARGAPDARPLEMTKWFDTNYHYLVPELAPDSASAPARTTGSSSCGSRASWGSRHAPSCWARPASCCCRRASTGRWTPSTR